LNLKAFAGLLFLSRPPPPPKTMKTRDALRIIVIGILALLATAALIYSVYLLGSVILLVILAIFFAYLIAPLVDLVEDLCHLTKRRIPRGLAIGLVYLGLVVGLWLSLSLLLPYLGDQIGQFKEQAPGYVEGVKGKAKQYNELYTQKLPANVREKIKRQAIEKIDSVSKYAADEIPTLVFSVAGGLAHYLPWLILVPVLGFFLLKDAGDFRASALEMLPRGRWRWRGDELFQDLNRTLAAYIRAQLIACLLIGTVCTLAFLLLGVPYALLLGLLAGLLEFIPLVGPLVVAIITGLITFVVTTSPQKAGVVILFLVVLRIIHDYVTYPRIIGQGIHLHPLAVVLSILAGAELGGIPGIFLAIPVVAIVTVLHRHWLEHRGSEGLVADILTTTPPPSGKRAKKNSETKPPARPTKDTTPEDMAHSRPDLLTGELRLDKLERKEKE
jgi:predicted PurR-regulated permease PerM